MPRTAIIAVQELDNGELAIVDANGGQHSARNAAALWVVLKQVLADPGLPEVEMPNPQEVDFEEAVTEFVQAQMPPGLGRLAGPAVSGLLNGLRNISRKNPTR